MYESLARAYSNYASGFINNQYGDLFVNKDSDRKLIHDSGKISKSRIKKFIDYVDKGIYCYEKIININPNYDTKVGSIKLKCANEYVYKYFMLKMCGDTFEISKDLKHANYSDSIIKVAKKYLDNVAKNGILITYGDNDTYPLWYLQVYKNYRKDVVVINNSLLGMKRYLKMLEVEFKGEMFSTTSAVYYKKNFEYFLKNENTDSKQAISAATFIKNIHNQQSKKDKISNGRDIVGVPLYDGEPMIQYKNATIFFTGKDKKILKIKLQSYLPINDFMLIDQ
jgi:hypothetical protein